MAGSSTQSMENFTAQGMEQHQMMMNTEVMKHFRIMNRASIREIMLQHEKTFKEQVHDLHKLYEVQRFLMDKDKGRGLDVYLGGPPPSPRGGNAKSEENNHQLGQRRNFWEQVTPNGTQNAAPEKNIRWEDTVKSVNSPVRKRKIDLEQLPEDDSDDEMENSMDAHNPTSSSLSGSSRELTKGGHSGFESVINKHQSPSVGTGFQSLQPVRDSQVSSLLTGESSLYKSNVDGSRLDSCFPSQYGNAPNSAANVVKTEQNFANLGERNMSFQNASKMNAGIDSIKSNTVFLPQPDLIDRASQDAGREAHWFFQASEANVANRSSKFPLQQQQRPSPHLALPEQSTSRSQLHNGTLHGSPNAEQRHHNNKSPPLESVSSIVGDWNKEPVEQHSPGLPIGAQKDRSFGSSERSGDTSMWFTKEPLSQGPLASVIPMARFETRAPEGGPALPAPAIAVTNNKGLSHERDMNTWPSQNPILQLPQYQQPPVFQPQVFPSVNQAVWLQSSQSTQNSLYSQQVVYGIHPSDAVSQIGYRAESLQRNQGDIASPWNMIGLGHYYSSVPPAPQKRPFKKPPKLVLKNDGVGMELKLVSPEKEVSEKVIQKKPLNPFKRDSSQDSSKSCERKSGPQKEAKEDDQKHEKRNKSVVEIPSTVAQSAEPPRTVSALESKPLASAASSLSQEIISPKESTLSHSATPIATLSVVSQCDDGAVPSTIHSAIGAGLIVSASPDTFKTQHCASQPEKVLPSQDQEKIAQQSLPDLKSSQAACVQKALPWTNTDIAKDIQGEKSESNSLQCKDEMGTLQDLKALSARELTSEVNADDVAATGQSVSFDVTLQDVRSKIPEESVVGVSMRQQQARKSANHSHELGQSMGSHLAPCATADSSSKEASQSRGVFQGRPLRHSADLTIPSSSQPITQAVSMQSTSTDTPNNTKQDKKRSSKALESCATRKVSGKGSSVCKGESATPTSDRDCLSAPSLTSLMSESRPEATVGVSIEELPHDSDSDNLAATILLSFAPKIDLNNGKHSKGKVGVISGSSLKDKPIDQASSKTSRSTEGASGLQSETFHSGGSQGRRMQGQGSFKRTDRHDRQQEPTKSTMKDKLRREERKSAELLQADKGEEDVAKSIMIKLPRVAAGTLTDEAIPISRSKQLNKLNGVADTVDYTKTFKGNDAFHTPTGRRSSRGPPMAARVPHESRARLHPQTQHCLGGSPTEKDSGSREEGGGGMRNKLEGNMKSKAWGELNRTRSHPRKQFQEISHRKTQK